MNLSTNYLILNALQLQALQVYKFKRISSSNYSKFKISFIFEILKFKLFGLEHLIEKNIRYCRISCIKIITNFDL